MRWLLCCLLLSFTAQAASVLLIPVDEKARVLADDLVEPFGANKLIVKMAGPGSTALNCLKDPATRDACLGTIEEKAKVEAVFVVSGALKGGKANLTIEMLSKGAVLKKETLKVTKGKVKLQMRGPIAGLLKLLPKSDASAPTEAPKLTVTETPREAEPVVEPAPPTRVADAPKKSEPVVLTPTSPTSSPQGALTITTPAPKASKPKVAAWVVTGLAIAAAGTAATFGGLGLAGKSKLETVNAGQSALSYTEATALQQNTNTQFTVALGAGIGAGVTGVVAGILWGVE